MELPNAEMLNPYMTAAKAALVRLKYERDAGREEFEAAEQLRKQSQWTQALRAYQAVVKDFGASDYAPRSELAIGHCLVGLQRADQAAAHWKKFIEPQPAGPWRAQALVALIDIYLEEELDLPQAAKFAALAGSSLPTAVADAKAGESWKSAAFDVQLRVGLVSFCESKNALAAEAFAAARELTKKKTVIDSLDALISAAKAGTAVIPEDCRSAAKSAIRNLTAGASAKTGPQSAIETALSMGIIYHLAGRDEQADAFFDRVLGRPAIPAKRGSYGTPARRAMCGATPAQLAFAIFGKGAVLQTLRKTDTAKEMFMASMKAFDAGTWHDETLYRVATIIQDSATAKHPKPAAEKAGNDKAARRLSSKQRQAANEAKKAKEQERLAALMATRAEALPYWRELIEKYPNSPRREEAMYSTGVLLYELAACADAAKSEKAFKQAAAALQLFCETYPITPFASDAYVRQIDIALERMFDLVSAQKIAALGVAWAKATSSKSDKKSSSATPPPWALSATPIPNPKSLTPDIYEVYLRAGLVAYLEQKFDLAAGHFKAAGPIKPPGGFTANADLAHMGLYYMVKAASSGKSVTEERALTDIKTDRQRTAIQLADLYLYAIRPDKAEEIFVRIAEGDKTFGREDIAVQGYAMLQLATCLDRQRGRRPEALIWLEKLAGPKYAKTYWGPYGLFRLALFTYNQRQKPQESMPIYKEMFTKYPAHPMAELAMLYYCLNATGIKDSELVGSACRAFLKKYPASEFRELVTKTLNDNT